MEYSLKLLMNYIQALLNEPEKATLRPEDLSPDFQELGEQLTLLADTIHQLTNQLQQKTEMVEMENQVLLDNIRAMDEIRLVSGAEQSGTSQQSGTGKCFDRLHPQHDFRLFCGYRSGGSRQLDLPIGSGKHMPRPPTD